MRACAICGGKENLRKFYFAKERKFRFLCADCSEVQKGNDAETASGSAASCPVCKNPVSADANFCSVCGHSVLSQSVVAEEISCPVCGSPDVQILPDHPGAMRKMAFGTAASHKAIYTYGCRSCGCCFC